MANHMSARLAVDGANPSLSKLRACVSIARIDHWTKNVFIVPGVIIPITLVRIPLGSTLFGVLGAGFLAVGLIASSNYTINELLDAPFDRFHPVKKFRPIPQGLVSAPAAYGQCLFFIIAGRLLLPVGSRA